MRSSIARVARPLASQQLRQFSARAAARPSILAAPSSSLLKSQKVVVAPQWSQMRFASGSSLSKDDIKARVLDVLKSFEKVDPAKVTETSSFTQDLGLDSLDAVEVVLAVEEEFSIEIPDEEADGITTVGQAIDYISKTPEAH
ncbi:acyl carrier protein [Cystobasidium minutum MCA 4210]|uniref:acyl carrier protein n=1 Tax=Cystobasidium minutum MCA 4210 TaxID=1397322 RepID=UPI0034CF21BC|eukprot:jgi/Rhomi1/169045/fgenesh1_kg.3_\